MKQAFMTFEQSTFIALPPWTLEQVAHAEKYGTDMLDNKPLHADRGPQVLRQYVESKKMEWQLWNYFRKLGLNATLPVGFLRGRCSYDPDIKALNCGWEAKLAARGSEMSWLIQHYEMKTKRRPGHTGGYSEYFETQPTDNHFFVLGNHTGVYAVLLYDELIPHFRPCYRTDLSFDVTGKWAVHYNDLTVWHETEYLLSRLPK